jgi:hypothetical protein
MKVRQISIFLENRSGRLASVLKEVGRAGVNIGRCRWRTRATSASCG